ncbi:unnamed protein product, partial [marine sediment metagenome]
IPLGFYWERGVTSLKEHAFIRALWDRVGYRIRDRCVVLRGNFDQSGRKGKFWRYDPLNKSLILSCVDMTNELLPNYVAKIREFRPNFIQAYPSVIAILARFMKKNSVKPFPSVEALLCGSENLYPWQRELLEEVFQCKVYTWYGHRERTALAGECEKSTYYHIQPEYGIMELINKHENAVTNKDELGEIVATGFNNFICPFIRYRTMDLAILSNAKCKCGRDYVLLSKTEGKLQYFFVDKTGSLITSFYSDEGPQSLADKIEAYQYVQNKPGKVLLNICAKSEFSNSEIGSVKRTFLDFYPRFDIEVEFVDQIPRTESGKFKFLVQKLPIEFGDFAQRK